ncbi:TasA family protein [Methanosarcina siciliae]|uniref:TasA family protein n=1 Tax=Methanosarcina siciliae TaxID=38027 RepID=UPI00064EFC43|nr:TasA family protein [Methanosarcina siciliae]
MGGKIVNKRIILIIFVLGLAVNLASVGTWAAFQDTETNTGNTFSSGTLDMKSNDSSTYSGSLTAT